MASISISGLPPGTQISRYELISELGAGSFGITYRARDLDRGIDVAIKEYLPKEIAVRTSGRKVELRSPEHERFYQWGMDRFVTEAQILAQFRHSNIVKVLNYFHDNGTAYFVMEYQAGRDLDRIIKTKDHIMVEDQIRAWLVPVLSGLNTIHQKNYLHRDIKPGNIFLTRSGTPVLLDFGAACFAMGDEVRKTSDVLTPAYASIEQYGHQAALGPWSDLYALGATVYRCFVKKAPISAYNRSDAFSRGAKDPLLPASKVGEDFASPEFLRVIDWMMTVVAAERPQSADDVLVALGEKPLATADVGKVFLAAASGSGVTVSDTRPNVSRPQEEYKLLFCGSSDAGKTTAVSVLGDVPAMTTELWPGALGGRVKRASTIAHDYAYMDLGSNERIHLYGTPGAPKFKFMGDLLKVGAFGVVVLIDNRQQDSLVELERMLEQYSELLEANRLVIGVTHMDKAVQPGIDHFQQWLFSYCRNRVVIPPVFDVDARSARDLKLLIQALFYANSPVAVTA
ncbi:MAG: protein kinase [Immundisolibacteraceae bacterium]|nr:protein kinase [Immundisolibacteraceae bacterium]